MAFEAGIIANVGSGCEGHVAEEVDLLFRVAGVALDRVELVLAHDSLSNIDSVHITPVTNIPEPEVQVVALKADPVTNSLHLCRLSSLLQLFPLVVDHGRFTANLTILINSGLLN